MSKLIYLSYPLSSQTPAYGGGVSFKNSSDKAMGRGDSCNTSTWTLSNHLGTHVDFPRHFAVDGNTASNYPASFWSFSKPNVIELPSIKPGQIINAEMLEHAKIASDADLLLLKSGFCNLRDQNVYWQNNPGLDPDVAEWLRENRPLVKVVGFDFISVSSFTSRELGREAHTAFLNNTSPILLLEDVNLAEVGSEMQIKKAVIAPLIVKDSDAAPCTIFADIEG